MNEIPHMYLLVGGGGHRVSQQTFYFSVSFKFSHKNEVFLKVQTRLNLVRPMQMNSLC
jgi:hypothetical protein